MSPGENAEQPLHLLTLNRPWLWPSEVAELCCVSRATVYRWIEQGVMPTILNRRPYKIPRQEIEQLLSRLIKVSGP